MKHLDFAQLILLIVAASTSAGLIIVFYVAGFSRSDVATLAGSILGAAVTVVGAALVADRAQGREKREEQSLIKKELAILLSVSEGTSSTCPFNKPMTKDCLSSIHAMADIAESLSGFLNEVITYAKTLDLRQREELRALQTRVDNFCRFHEDVFASEEGVYPSDERSWPAVIDAVLTSARSTLSTFRSI